MHDGMESAEIGVVAGRQSLQCEAAAWPDDPGIECAGAPIFRTTQMRDRMVSGRGVVPSDRDFAGYGGRLWDKIG